MTLDVVVPPRQLRDHILAAGQQVVTLSDVAQLAGLSRSAAATAMSRLRRSGQFFTPAAGLYVAIPPQYATWGVVPATDFIDPMMSKLKRNYYVSLLSAAELHGAAHQRPQVFQVMLNRALPDRDLERVRLRFYTHHRLDDVPVVRRNTSTGQMRVASPEATALDLAARPNDAGGLNNVATVLGELALENKLDAGALRDAATIYPLAVLRRLGWLLERVTEEANTDSLCVALDEVLTQSTAQRGRRPVDLLDPAGARRGRSSSRWGIVENTDVEPDL